MDTQGGRKVLELRVKDGVVYSVRVNMGVPILECARIPALCDAPRFVDMPYTASGMGVRGTLVNMGNPHSVVFWRTSLPWILGPSGRGLSGIPCSPIGSTRSLCRWSRMAALRCGCMSGAQGRPWPAAPGPVLLWWRPGCSKRWEIPPESICRRAIYFFPGPGKGNPSIWKVLPLGFMMEFCGRNPGKH